VLSAGLAIYLLSDFMRTLKNNTRFTSMALASMAFFIGGCAGDFSYKRGAGMNDFQQEREHCAEKNGTESEIELCLEKAGWVTVEIDKDLEATQAEATMNPKDDAIVVEQTIETTTTPSQKITINSWWKPGAGPEKLLEDGDICALKLGEDDKPEGNMSIVTIGLVNCMKDKGWLALKAK